MAVRLLVLGLVIGSNNLAVALALGSLGGRIPVARVVFLFGLIEFTIPLVGLQLGRGASSFLSGSAGFIAPFLLAAVGIFALVEAARGRADAQVLSRRLKSTGGIALLGLSLSLDNLVLGFGLGVQGDGPLLVATVIALFSTAFTWAGLIAGRRLIRWEPYARYGSGILLLFLAGFEWFR
jgi:manganese efflux pump family protein